MVDTQMPFLFRAARLKVHRRPPPPPPCSSRFGVGWSSFLLLNETVFSCAALPTELLEVGRGAMVYCTNHVPTLIIGFDVIAVCVFLTVARFHCGRFDGLRGVVLFSLSQRTKFRGLTVRWILYVVHAYIRGQCILGTRRGR